MVLGDLDDRPLDRTRRPPPLRRRSRGRRPVHGLPTDLQHTRHGREGKAPCDQFADRATRSLTPSLAMPRDLELVGLAAQRPLELADLSGAAPSRRCVILARRLAAALEQLVAPRVVERPPSNARASTTSHVNGSWRADSSPSPSSPPRHPDRLRGHTPPRRRLDPLLPHHRAHRYSRSKLNGRGVTRSQTLLAERQLTISDPYRPVRRTALPKAAVGLPLPEVEGRDHARRARVAGVTEERLDPEEFLGRLEQRVVVKVRSRLGCGPGRGVDGDQGMDFGAEPSFSSQTTKTTVLPAR